MNQRSASSPLRYEGRFQAITCYFNPVGYRRRLDNYRLFRKSLKVPLLTVELSFGGNFALRPDDADFLVQLQGSDVMWQKERLLNVALQMVPDSCDHIAWLDCDVVFERHDWPERAACALERFALVRLFHQRHDLLRDVQPNTPGIANSALVPASASDAADEAEDETQLAVRLDRCRSPGLAWAARRELLQRHGFYDACILGSGDRAILYAALGQFDETVRVLRMNARQLEHYLAWARPFFETVHGRVGYLQGRLFHLWHGDRNDREYRERHRLLEQSDFDPETDIAVDRHGCWRWSSEKHDLHESVNRYFRARQEDGNAASA